MPNRESFSSCSPSADREARPLAARCGGGDPGGRHKQSLTRGGVQAARAQMSTGGEPSVSKKSSVRFLVVLLLVTFTTAALVFADLVVIAQNANSSSTGEDMQNANMSTPRRSRRGRRGRRAAPVNANMGNMNANETNANTGEAAGENANMGGMATTGTGTHGRRGRRGRRRGAAAAAATTAAATETSGNMGGEQTDLSGTYSGTINCLDATGDATLTVTGNQFTLSGASSRSGRITAVTTRGYTGATLRFDDASGGTPTSVSVRARKMGDRLMLSPVPGETNRCSFTPGRGGGMGMGGGRRGRRGRRRGTMAAPPAPPAAGEESATPAMTETPAPRPRGRRRGRRRR